MHQVFYPDLPDAPSFTLEGDEVAHAARVKRLGTGDHLILTNGRGDRVLARILRIDRPRGGWSMTLETIERSRDPVPPLRVCVLAAAPKGDRLDWMIDQLVQVGAWSYQPLLTRRTIVDPREAKLHRLERIASEACKQSQRAWSMQILPAITLDAALDAAHGAARSRVLADAEGSPVLPASFAATGGEVDLFIGPEGGLEPAEIAAIEGAGGIRLSLGPHVLRIETAAVVGVAAVLAGLSARR